MSQRFAVMGAGQVGFHLASILSKQGHSVVVIDAKAELRGRVQQKLDVGFVAGNGAHVPVLEAAKVADCELFMAVSSNDEANLAAAVLAKRLGAKRTVVRVGVAQDITIHRRLYAEVFGIDLLLSTELLATTHILNHILGHNTLAVEYLAKGKVQLRRVLLQEGSVLTKRSLRDVAMPKGSLVVAFFRHDELLVPAGGDRAKPGDDALILCSSEVIHKVERMINPRLKPRGTVVIAGGGATAYAVAKALSRQVDMVKILENYRPRAEELAKMLPDFQVLYGDATDVSFLRAERLQEAKAFVALTGHDEGNLMASLLAQELGVEKVIALVDRTETSHLWRKLGLMNIVSPRLLAAGRIQDYITSGFSSNIVSLERGKAQVFERRLVAASPAAGVTLAEIKPPRGVIVGAVARGDKVFVPRGEDRLEVGDLVILFVQEEHVPMVHLLFPGRSSDKAIA